MRESNLKLTASECFVAGIKRSLCTPATAQQTLGAGGSWRPLIAKRPLGVGDWDKREKSLESIYWAPLNLHRETEENAAGIRGKSSEETQRKEKAGMFDFFSVMAGIGLRSSFTSWPTNATAARKKSSQVDKSSICGPYPPPSSHLFRNSTVKK